jgi:hypothetical protein
MKSIDVSFDLQRGILIADEQPLQGFTEKQINPRLGSPYKNPSTVFDDTVP